MIYILIHQLSLRFSRLDATRKGTGSAQKAGTGDKINITDRASKRYSYYLDETRAGEKQNVYGPGNFADEDGNSVYLP